MDSVLWCICGKSYVEAASGSVMWLRQICYLSRVMPRYHPRRNALGLTLLLPVAGRFLKGSRGRGGLQNDMPRECRPLHMIIYVSHSATSETFGEIRALSLDFGIHAEPHLAQESVPRSLIDPSQVVTGKLSSLEFIKYFQRYCLVAIVSLAFVKKIDDKPAVDYLVADGLTRHDHFFGPAVENVKSAYRRRRRWPRLLRDVIYLIR